MKFLVAVLLAFTLSFPPSLSYAQGKGTTQTETELKGPRKQLATIIFAGLAGAVLGLSTLSFYGRPQDHLKNIAVGFAIGVMGGTGYVAYQATMRPEDFYSGELGMNQFNRGAFDNYSVAQNEKVVGPLYFQWEF